MLKRIICILITSVIVVSPVCAQDKREVKAVQKEAKAMVKQYEKEGFRSIDMRDLQPQFENYLYGVRFGHKPIIGIADDCPSRSLALKEAKNEARSEYAAEASADVSSIMLSNTSGVNEIVAKQILDEYKVQASAQINGELNECVVMMRQRKNRYDVRVFYLIDYEAAHAANMRAMKRALEKLDLLKDYDLVITEWIN